MSAIHYFEVAGRPDQPDPHGAALRAQIAEMLGTDPGETRVHHCYWIQGDLSAADLQRIGSELLADPVVEDWSIDAPHATDRLPDAILFAVRPGVTDPAAAHVALALADMQLTQVKGVVTGTRVCFAAPLPADHRSRIATRLLFNPMIQRELAVQDNPFLAPLVRPPEVRTIPIRELDAAGLEALSREGLLALTLTEMERIQAAYREWERDPTDAELETLAQTWSEHCVHKTLKGRYILPDRTYQNLLKETIFSATVELAKPWCISVFEDNAGVIAFEPGWHACFKVETHNHPSAIEPYGGAGTGIGGVIRDILGTGLGATPVANTDVFCFAPPDLPAPSIPEGVLHPRRIMRGVVSGVRDYGNRMGIPTINGAVYFDSRFVTNPLVFCGTVGLLPADRVAKAAQPGDRIACIGGATGRDGIHGATFSSLTLDSASEETSQGAVQIGNPIMEKRVMDALIKARDAGLIHAITDCGAGGLSSAVGEMGSELGARVHLEQVPLKYQGLQPWEIWVSEAQERMVCAIAPADWDAFAAIMAGEGVPCTDIGEFPGDGQLEVCYRTTQGDDLDVVRLPMQFLHQELPKREFHPVIRTEESPGAPPPPADYAQALLELLAHPTIASQAWVVRQYDHEVQGRSALKPLVGIAGEGPGDAAVLRPMDDRTSGLVVSNGLCPRYGPLNAYQMALNAIDEAIRNAVAVGADPAHLALLDNFAWGTVDTPEAQGDLLQAAEACRDASLAYGTPFISGKDSLRNEYAHQGERWSIPPTLLVSAIARHPDVTKCVSSALSAPTDILFQLGQTQDRWGGSMYGEIADWRGGEVPRVDPPAHRVLYERLFSAIHKGLVRACHDLSEGGLLVAAAEMALGAGLGLRLDLAMLAREQQLSVLAACFAEGPGRLLITAKAEDRLRIEQHFAGLPCIAIGQVEPDPRLRVYEAVTGKVLQLELAALRNAWLQFSQAQGLIMPAPRWAQEAS